MVSILIYWYLIKIYKQLLIKILCFLLYKLQNYTNDTDIDINDILDVSIY